MIVPKKIVKKYPDGLKIFKDIDGYYKSILTYKKDIVTPVGKEITPKIIWKLQTYEQFTIHRVLDFIETIISSWKKFRPSIAFILNRAMIENVVILYDSIWRIDRLLNENKKNEIDELIMKVIFGSKVRDEEKYKATNIITILKRINKTFPGIWETYESESEFVHPNRDALIGLYGHVEEDGEYMTCNIDNKFGVDESTIKLFFKSFVANIGLFDLTLSELNQLYDLLFKFYDS